MEVEMDAILYDGFNNEYEQYSGCCSTSTTEDQHNNGSKYLNNWSPAINWEPLYGDADDFHGLIDSMMLCNNSSAMGHNENEFDKITDHDQPWFSTTTCEGSPPTITEGEGDDRGLRLIHLLIAAAEALKGVHKSRELSRVILVRLKELVPPYGCGTNMERLAAYFTDALQSLLDGHREDNDHMHPSDVLWAYQLLQDMSPYVKFGHFTVNQAILESVSVSNRVHIVDYDIMEGSQWASLMQAMVSKKNGPPPPPHLRITAITRNNGNVSNIGRKIMNSVQETGRRLTAFAASIGLPFSFGQCRLDNDQKFRPSAVKIVKGETVIANCVLHPPHIPHRSAASVASFLKGAATIGAKLITVVEEECESKNSEDENAFIALFMDELHRYSAIWDSLEAGFPLQGRARGLVEKAILGPRISSAVARAYRKNGEELEGEGGWGNWLENTGFRKIGISSFNHCQARLLLGLFNEGYRIEEGAFNKLILSWKLRRLISASIWSPPLQSPPPSTTTSGYLT